MPADSCALDWFIAYQRGVFTRKQALAGGVTVDALRYRIRPGGPWQRLLPGIYLTTTGKPTREQMEIAALLFAGPDSAIIGLAALRACKIGVPELGKVDVLVPAALKRASCGYVTVHRTRRMPSSISCDGPLRYAPAARAVADAVRGLVGLPDARALVASAVQQRRCTVADLAVELRDGPVRSSARLRAILAEVRDGTRSVTEGDFRKLVTQSGLPVPLFNATLYLHGKFLATADAWWEEFGLAAEVDSREWHLAPDTWEKTMDRHRRLAAAGIRTLHFSPREMRTDPARLIAQIADALCTGHPVPGITTVAAIA